VRTLNAIEIEQRKAALKSTIESLSKPIVPLQKELDELNKIKKEKGTK